MTDTKTFTAHTLLSVATGLGTGCSFSDMHEAIEHLLGEPVWTHQLGSPEPWSRARAALVAQYPKFADVDGDTLREQTANVESREEKQSIANAWVEAEVVTLGADSFVLVRGEGRNYEDAAREAIRSLTALGKPAIIASASDDT